MVLYTKGTEVAALKFNASETNNLSWFSQDRLVQSPWIDLKDASNPHRFSIFGDIRNFEISNVYGGCSGDTGWFVITKNRECDWEARPRIPSILYSKLETFVKWTNYGMYSSFVQTYIR